MILQMNPATYPCQELDDNDFEIDTGQMSDCVSVIVSFQRNGKQVMRGHHGRGGIQEVNFDGLFQGMPNERSTKIYIIPGDTILSGFMLQLHNNVIQQKVREVWYFCTIIVHPHTGRAVVNRDGVIRTV